MAEAFDDLYYLERREIYKSHANRRPLSIINEHMRSRITTRLKEDRTQCYSHLAYSILLRETPDFAE